jgi:hypothetical protein
MGSRSLAWSTVVSDGGDLSVSTAAATFAPVFNQADFMYDGDGKRVKSAITTHVGATTMYIVEIGTPGGKTRIAPVLPPGW